MTLRLLIAVSVLVSGAVHGKLWLDGYRDIEVIGPSFLLNVIAAVVIAVAVLVWQHWLPLVAAVGFGASTLAAFVISATVGLFGVHERWTGGAVLTAAVSEIIAVVAGGVALLLHWRGVESAPELEHSSARHRLHLH